MHRSSRQPAAITLMHFGFGDGRLYIRVEVSGRAIDLLAGGQEVAFEFVNPAGVRFSVRSADGRLSGTFWDRQDDDPRWQRRGPGSAVVAVGTIIEAAFSTADLRVEGAATIKFFVTLSDGMGIEVERHPADQPIETPIPDGLFAARRWRV